MLKLKGTDGKVYAVLTDEGGLLWTEDMTEEQLHKYNLTKPQVGRAKIKQVEGSDER